MIDKVFSIYNSKITIYDILWSANNWTSTHNYTPQLRISLADYT